MPTVILTNIEIWVSGLDNRDKFKAVVSLNNIMYKPVLSAINQELWTPHHNFGVYRWYNVVLYKWAQSRAPSGSSYQYYEKLSTGIIKLTPALIQSHELAVTFQKIV